jgi:hypothetical protein
MSNGTDNVIRNDFLIFSGIAFAKINNGAAITPYPYVRLLAKKLARVNKTAGRQPSATSL